MPGLPGVNEAGESDNAAGAPVRPQLPTQVGERLPPIAFKVPKVVVPSIGATPSGSEAVLMNSGTVTGGVVAVLLVSTACGTTAGATCVTIWFTGAAFTKPRAVIWAESSGAIVFVGLLPVPPVTPGRAN